MKGLQPIPLRLRLPYPPRKPAIAISQYYEARASAVKGVWATEILSGDRMPSAGQSPLITLVPEHFLLSS